MRYGFSLLPGLALCAALAIAGNRLAETLGVPVPGAILGMMCFGGLLATGHWIDWSRRGAALLVRWLGAMIVPALVGLQAYWSTFSAALVPLLLLLVVTTLVTGITTAALYRLMAASR